MAKQKKEEKLTDIRQFNYGKVPPQSVDIERAVLGAILYDKDVFDRTREYIPTERVFYDNNNEIIFKTMCFLAQEKRPIDAITVTEELRKCGKLDEVGGVAYISSLADNIATAANAEYHAKLLFQKFVARELIRVSTDIQTDAFEDKKDITEMLAKAESAIFEISQNNIRRDVRQIGSVVTEAIKRIYEMRDNAKDVTGIPSGFKDLDAITSGWQNSDLIIIAARPSMGKTAFVLSMITNIAVEYKIPCAVFSLEMSTLQLVNRVVSDVCEIPSERIRNGKLEPYEFVQLEKRISKLDNAPIFIDDTPGLSITEFRSKAIKLVEEHHVRLIAVDYLQLMNAQGMTFFNREGEVSLISRHMKGLAKELNIPIIALSQLNRNVENRGGASNKSNEAKKPQLSDLRESGAIEQDADMVCFIHRPAYYGIKEIVEDNGTVSTEGKAQIIIAKHRNGRVGDIWLQYKSEFTKFCNVGGNTYYESKQNEQYEVEADDERRDDYPF